MNSGADQLSDSSLTDVSKYELEEMVDILYRNNTILQNTNSVMSLENSELKNKYNKLQVFYKKISLNNDMLSARVENLKQELAGYDNENNFGLLYNRKLL